MEEPRITAYEIITFILLFICLILLPFLNI